MKDFAFGWDYKYQPDWDEIFKAIHDLNLQDLTASHYIIDTMSDEYGLLISAYSGYTRKEAFDTWYSLQT